MTKTHASEFIFFLITFIIWSFNDKMMVIVVPIIINSGGGIGDAIGAVLGMIIAYGIIFGAITIYYRDVCSKLARVVGAISLGAAIICIIYLVLMIIKTLH